VPANRSRTNHWRRCLSDILDRNGAIEIAISHNYEEGEEGSHLLWRVRLLKVTDEEIVVEEPCALGQQIPLRDGVDLVAIFAIGQNRWMFNTTKTESLSFTLNERRSVHAIRLRAPDDVQRCPRRNYYRVATATVIPPRVDVWPLLDPKSVALAERINELQFHAEVRGSADPGTLKIDSAEAEITLPEVGPRFEAELLNLGGGGVGLRVAADDSQHLARHKIFWMRFKLPSESRTPICATAKLAHTHVQSNHDVYAGLAFDFTFNPAHQKLVVEQICKYTADQQRAQLQRASTHRRVA
jgi:hypothetical protein